MQFETGPWMRQVVGFGDRKELGKEYFGDKCGAPHCNQWRVFGIA